MTIWSNLRKLTIWSSCLGTGIGIAVGTAYIYHSNSNYDFGKVYASWTTSDRLRNPCATWDSNWDCRNPTFLVKPIKDNSPNEENRFNSQLEKMSTKAVHHIIMIRHGEYLDEGDNDETHNLTNRGRLQAKYTGQRLHDLGIKWNKAVVSTMTRAQETAAIIFKQIDIDPKTIENCNYIREGAPIPPEPPVGHWKPEELFFRDGARIEAGFRRYFHRALPTDQGDTYTLLIGHGNVIRYFVCRALQFPPEAWLRININHASITWLTISPSGNVSIKCLGDSGFMPVEYLTNRIPTSAKNVV